jgi:alpha-tubulin suppressor-like RCC1 family protein
MAFQFPNSPTVGQTVNNTSSGQVLTWDGSAWNTAPVTSSQAITSSFSTTSVTASFAQTASYYASRLNIEKISNAGLNGAFILAEGKVYMFRGGTGGLDFWPYGGWAGGSYLDQASGLPNTTEIIFPNESGNIIDVDIYGNSAYALFENGNLYTWGENTYGQLGQGNANNNFFPTLATTNVVQVYETINSATSFFPYSRLFIRKTDGKVYGCGYNAQGALGLGNYTANITSFTEITALGTNPIGVWNINGYDGWTIAQKSDGNIVACGANGGNPIGTGAAGNPNTFQTVNGWKNGFNGAIIQKVRGSANWQNGGSVNYSSNMNIWIKNGADSYVMFCGDNAWGNAGVGNTTNRTTPIAATLPTTIVDFERIGGSPAFNYVLLADGTVRAWGYNNLGTLGNGNSTNQLSPVQVLTGANAFYLGNTNCPNYNLNLGSIIIRKTDGTFWRAGSNNYAQLANGINVNSNVFVRMLLPNNFPLKMFATFPADNDAFVTLAVTQDNKIYAWGYNTHNTIIDAEGNNSIFVPFRVQPSVLLR